MHYHGFNSASWLCGPGALIPGPFGILLTLLFWGLLIMLLVQGLSYVLGKTRRRATSQSNGLRIAQERYAQGDITKSEFEQIKRDLA